MNINNSDVQALLKKAAWAGAQQALADARSRILDLSAKGVPDWALVLALESILSVDVTESSAEAVRSIS